MAHLPQDLTRVALSLYERLNTPRSLTAAILLRYREFDQLASLRADPLDYLEGPWGAMAYYRDAQASDFLRKSPLLPVSTNAEQAAVENFDKCELHCATMNNWYRNVRDLQSLSAYADSCGSILSFLARVKSLLRRILGPVPDDLPCRMGPGTVYELEGSAYTTQLDKMYNSIAVTDACRPLLEWSIASTSCGRGGR